MTTQSDLSATMNSTESISEPSPLSPTVIAHAIDHAYMAKALVLAKKGVFTTSPNPRVGCVIVKNNAIVGEGFHEKAGEPHAEVFALRMAGEQAEGATAYVTLEPCSHYGRTPPCAKALIAAKVSRVVVAMQDPFPEVAGRGLAMLQEAGIEVVCGVMEAEARQLNRGFLSRVERGRPFVTAKMAASLDGKTALANGVSQWITSPDARSDVQRSRAEHCAILSGSGTVLADDPSLNVRYDELGFAKELIDINKLRQPLRIIVDGRNQLHANLKIFSLPGDILVVNLQNNTHLPEHVSQWQAPSCEGKVDLAALMVHLGTLSINNLWIEAGNRLLGALMQAQQVDELVYYIAPKLMGNPAQGVLDSPQWQSMEETIQLQWLEQTRVGQDLKLTAQLVY